MLRLNPTILFLLVINLTISCNDVNEDIINNEIIYKTKKEVSIVPKVKSLLLSEGYFEVNSETVILVWNDSTQPANYLKSLIDSSLHTEIPIIRIKDEEFENYTNYILVSNNSKMIGIGTYGLNIDSSCITISAMSNIGARYAVQTLRQLFVDEFHLGKKRNNWYLPCVKIDDYPKFQHRGLLLDCSRHFFKKEVIKKYIDVLALYKMNVLHWHLTEDQGWRIEIDAFPKLTEIGAWRTELDSSNYGGFYTKVEIKEIVTYANERGITIIPEIELPGHSQAAIAAYPNLSCTGQQVQVANDWGVFKEIYCAGNDSVFQFIETVLDEVLELFPSQYIHIGGDEAPKFRWKHCPKCQRRMKNNGLNDEHELQSYFIRRVEKYLNNKGRKLIGWDEILEGGLSENATVQSWRGMEGGILAAKSGHNAVMSPTSHAYFDYDLKSIDMEKVYEFDPIPSELSEIEAAFIIGGECNMWTEHVSNDSILDSKVFPRLLAMSEVLWSYPKHKDYDDFYNRVQFHYPILESLGVNYGDETVPVTTNTVFKDERISIIATPGHESWALKYRWNCDTCKGFLMYQKPIDIIRSGVIEFQAFKENKAYGKPVKKEIKMHKGLNKVVDYKTLYNNWYKSNEILALVDGQLGSIDFRDNNWQGFWGNDIIVEIRLDSQQVISYLETHFYQYINSWIFIPKEVIFEGSIDGKNYVLLGKVKPKTSQEKRGKNIEKVSLNVNSLNLKYIKLSAKNIGKVPDWHEAAGSDSWLFIDEIVVR